MLTPFAIAPKTGDILLGGIISLEPKQAKDLIEPKVLDLLGSSRDHGNGYEWLALQKLSFGGQPAGLSLCFYNGQLQQATWSIQLPGARVEDNWPTQEAIEAEVTFVKKTLSEEMGLFVGQQAWGEIWSVFDQKGFIASNGLKYQ